MTGWWTKKLTGQQPSPAGRPAAGPQQPPAGSSQPADPNGQVHASQAAEAWQGTQEQRSQSGHCHKCGSTNFWNVPSQGSHVPRCFDCGSTIIVQYGSEQGTGGSQQKINPQAGEYGGQARQPQSFYTGAHTDTVIARVN